MDWVSAPPAARLKQERLAFDVWVPVGDAMFVLDHVEPTALRLSAGDQPLVDVALPGPAGAARLSGQSVLAVLRPVVHLVTLSGWGR